MEEAREAVFKGEAWGVISMTSNFSAALLERMFNALETDANTRNQSKISVSKMIGVVFNNEIPLGLNIIYRGRVF